MDRDVLTLARLARVLERSCTDLTLAQYRLLAMIAIDTEDTKAATEHVDAAAGLFQKLHDPWGDLETRILRAQIALTRGSKDAEALVAECEAIDLDEAEPRQHRALTRAWLCQRQAKWEEADKALDAARAAFGESGRAADHTPQLLERFSKLVWMGPALPKIRAWLRVIEQQDRDDRSSVDVSVDMAGG